MGHTVGERDVDEQISQPKKRKQIKCFNSLHLNNELKFP